MAKEKSNNMKIKATPKKDPNIGIDTKDTFLTDLTDAIKNSVLDMSKLEGFTGVTQSRENIYRIIDTMAQDSIVSSILSTFAEDSTETNTQGKIIWAEASDGSINNVVNYILNMLNVDKHIYTWAMYLVKYGDVYVRLFRQSDYEKDKVTASIKSPLNENLELLDENVDKKLEEDIKIVAYSKNDPYSYYVEAIQDPCGMFELTRHGKTMGYISAPINTQTLQNPSYITTQLNYKFNKQDVTIYPATEFVHGYLADTSNRTPEKISLYIDKDTADSEDSVKLSEVTYDVRRGQSILIPAFKAWRELSLLENSILLDRVTKSSIVRVISVEVGDMPKTQVQNHLQSIKSLMEQKSALNTGEYLNEYTNPGPIENNIYVPTRNSVGNISVSQIGGDVDVKSLVDLEHFQNKFFGSFGIPKQYFCLRGDTKLTLLNGEEITIKELFDNKDSYIGKGILSCNEDGSLEPTTITNIMLTRKDASFIRVYLDNGEHVDVTPDHRFMLRDGSYKEAQYLTENDSLMPYYERFNKYGRKEVLNNKTGKYIPQYKLVATTKFEYIPKGNQKHHTDSNKLNDDFDNLENLTVAEHYKKHEEALHSYARQKNAEKRLKGINHGNKGKFSVTNGLTNMWLDRGDEIPEGFYKGQTCDYSEEGRKSLAEKAKNRFTGKKPWNKGQTKYENESIRVGHLKAEQTRKQREALGLYEESKKRASELIKKWAAEHRQENREAQLRKHDKSRWILPRTLRCPVCGKVFTRDLNQDNYEKYLNKEKFIGCCHEHTSEISRGGKTGRSYKLLETCGFDYSKYNEERTIQKLRRDCYYKEESLRDMVINYNLMEYSPECNHRVVKIENLPVVEDSYDIEVASSNHNFVLTAGIFVHNCETSDNAGFSGGQSLAIISSRYGKKVKRIQTVLVQLVTDIINIYLMQKGLISYINKFNIKMNTPVTQEEIDKRDSKKSQIEYIQSVVNLLSDVQTPSIKLQIIKSLLSTALENEEITALLQEEVDKLKQEEAENEEEEVVEEESITEEPYEPTLDRDEDNEESSSISDLIDNTEEQAEPEEVESDTEEETGEEVTSNDSYLPSPEELQVDLTRRI